MFAVFSCVLEQVSDVTLSEKNWIFFRTASQSSQRLQRSENSLSSNHENRASDANGCLDWLIYEDQSVNPSREAIFLLLSNKNNNKKQGKQEKIKMMFYSISKNNCKLCATCYSSQT